MKYVLFSPSTEAFYDPALGYPDGSIPGDAVRVRRDRHGALVDARAAHAELRVDRLGRVTAGPVPTIDRLALVRAQLRAEVARRILAVAPIWAQLNALREGKLDDPMFAAVDDLRSKSNAIDATIAELDGDTVATFDPCAEKLWS